MDPGFSRSPSARSAGRFSLTDIRFIDSVLVYRFYFCSALFLQEACMFITLLLVIFLIAAATSSIAAFLFSTPVSKILVRLISEELAPMWKRYIVFAVFVVGISGGIRLWEMEKYITPDKEGKLVELTSDRWTIEIYKTIIESLQSIAWMLLIFFLFALIGYVIMRGFEAKRNLNPSRIEPS
jgi:hypothetical protein